MSADGVQEAANRWIAHDPHIGASTFRRDSFVAGAKWAESAIRAADARTLEVLRAVVDETKTLRSTAAKPSFGYTVAFESAYHALEGHIAAADAEIRRLESALEGGQS